MAETLAQKIRKKYPKDYDDLDDVTLESKWRAKYPGDYDDIPLTTAAPAKPERGLLGTAASIVLSPIPAVSRFSQRLANKVEGVDRGVEEPHQVETPTTVRGTVQAAGNLINPMKEGNLLTAPFEAIHSIGRAIPGALEGFRADPIAALRGFLGGAITGAGNTSALDVATVAAPVGIRSAIGRRSSPGSSVKPAPPRSEVGAGGQRLSREKSPAVPLETTMQQVLQDIIEDTKKPISRQLPPADPAPPPTARGRVTGDDGVQRPAPGARFSIKAGSRTPEAEGGTKKMPPMKKMPVKDRPVRPEKRLEDLTEESTVAEVVEAVNAAARKEPELLAKRNPKLEELAAEMESMPEAPNKAVNKALVGETLPNVSAKVKPQPIRPQVDEMVARETGMVDESGRPLGGYTVPERRVADRGGPQGVDRRTAAATADEPIVGGVQNRVAAAQQMRKENPNIDAQAKAARERAMAAGRVKEPTSKPLNIDIRQARVMNPEKSNFVTRVLNDAGKGNPGLSTTPITPTLPNSAPSTRIVFRNSKGEPIASARVIEDAEGVRHVEELAVDSKAGLLRGKALKEVATKLQEMDALRSSDTITPAIRKLVEKVSGPIKPLAKTGERKPLESYWDAEEGKPISRASREAEDARRAKRPPPPLPKMPRLSAAPVVRVGRTGQIARPLEVPVTKVPAAQTKTVNGATVDNAGLSAGEKVQFQILSKQIPAGIKADIQAGKPIPPTMPLEMRNKATQYQGLLKKAQGKPVPAIRQAKAPADPPASTPPPAPVMVQAATVNGEAVVRRFDGSHIAVSEIKTDMAAAGSRIPPALRKAIDEGTDWPKMVKEEWTPIADDVMKYTGWRDVLKDIGPITARNKEIDNLAQSNVAAAAKAEGATPPTESLVSRSEAVAKEIALPSPETIPEIPAKVAAKAVDEVLNGPEPKGGKPQVRPYLQPKDIGPPPKGTSPRLWRTINANIIEAARLFKERGILDPRMIDTARRYFGAEEAARRIGISRNIVEEISGAPHKRRPMQEVLRDIEEQADARIKHLIDDPRGFMRAEAVVAAGGAAAGGLIGATFGGESLEDRFAATVSMTLLGGLAGLGAAKGIKAMPSPKAIAKSAGASFEALDTANLLAGPAAIKASLGSVGGVAAGIWQRMAEGRRADAMRGLKFMGRDAAPMWVKTVVGPMKGRTMQKQGALTSNVQGKAGKLPQFLLNQVLRPFVASDVVGKTALKRMGFSEEESLRLMLNGEPTSFQGQAVLKSINSLWLARMMAKFPRVRIGSLERGIEFTPGLSGRFDTRKAHGAEKLSRRALRGRAQFGGAALVAGTAYGYFRDPGLAEAGIASAAAGPAFLPAAMGVAAGRGLRRGGIPRALIDAGVEAAQTTPSVSDINVRSTLTGERFVPLRPLRRFLGAEQ